MTGRALLPYPSPTGTGEGESTVPIATHPGLEATRVPVRPRSAKAIGRLSPHCGGWGLTGGQPGHGRDGSGGAPVPGMLPMGALSRAGGAGIPQCPSSPARLRNLGILCSLSGHWGVPECTFTGGGRPAFPSDRGLPRC